MVQNLAGKYNRKLLILPSIGVFHWVMFSVSLASIKSLIGRYFKLLSKLGRSNTRTDINSAKKIFDLLRYCNYGKNTL